VQISLSFAVKDDVDPFSLGELSGSVKQILSLGKSEEFKYELKSSMNTESDGTKVYTLTFLWTDKNAHEAFLKIFDFYEPHTLELKVELNQEPSVPTSDFIAANLTFHTELARNSVRLLEATFGRTMTESDKKLLTLFRAARNFEFGLDFNNVQEVYTKVFGEQVPQELHNIGWSTVPVLIKSSPFGQKIHDPALPEPVRTIYDKLQLLKGLHGAKFQVGSHALKIATSHFDIFSLLPTLQDLN